VSLTVLLFLGVFGLGIFLAFFKHPFFGLLTYLWVFYNPPAQRWWGDVLPDLRWSLLAGIVTLVAIFLHSSSKDNRPFWLANWGIIIFILWTVWLWILSFWSMDLSKHIEGCILFSKFVLLFFLIYQLVVTEEDFENFVLANVVGGFIFGWIAYRNPGGGRFESVGGPGVNDSNTLAMHLAVVIALGGFLFLTFRGWKNWKKWIVFGSMPFIFNAIILTVSRQAVLGLMCGGLAAVVLLPAKKRKSLYGVGVLAFILLLFLGHDIFWERLQTILPDEQGQYEDSAASRFELLKIDWEIAKDYPWGVGYKGHALVIFNYIPEGAVGIGQGKAAHNSYMAVLVEEGFLGAFLYLALWGWLGMTIWRLKSLDRFGLKESLGIYRAGLGSGLVVLFICGMFTNYSNAEIGVWLLALVSSFSVLCHRSVRENSLVLSAR